MELKVKKLHPDAILPKYETYGAACFDLSAIDVVPAYVDEDYALVGGYGQSVFRTGLAFEVPLGWVMLIFSRSGHGFKNNVRLANCVGVIDSDYRGEVKVKLTADQGGVLTVKNGDRIAQAMLVQIPQVKLVEVVDLSETDRGAGGFGSTGK